MIGAIIGDLAGSVYEYEQFKSVKPIQIKKIIEPSAFISDDSILTIAILDAIINKKDYGQTLKEYGKKYNNVEMDRPYFETMFSPGFSKWVDGEYQGESMGNGAMMRISAVGYLFDTEEDVIKNAYLATIPSHNSESAIRCARIIALIIFLSRKGYSKQEIVTRLNLDIRKPLINTFNYTCDDTIDVCLYSWYYANSFKESIKLAISFGGDTDTNACIVGSISEAFYGVDEDLKTEALKKIPVEFKKMLDIGYKRIRK